MDLLKSEKFLPKNLGILKQRETAHPVQDGGHIFVTFDPQSCSSEPANKALIQWDVQLISRFIQTGSLKPKLGNYKWVPNFNDLINRVVQQFNETGLPVDVTCDTETMGLVPYHDDKDIVTIGFTDRPGYGECIYLGDKYDPCEIIQPNAMSMPMANGPSFQTVLEQLEWICTTPMIKMRGSNLKYDNVWFMEKYGFRCENFKFDNAIVGSLLDENRSNSLNVHTKVMIPELGGYDDELNDKYDKSHMEDIPPEDLLPYAAGDLDAAHQVADQLRDELLNEPALAKFYVTILQPAVRAFEKIEHTGIHVDVDKYQELHEELNKHIAEKEKLCISLLPGKLQYKYKDRIEEQLAQGKDPMLPSILKDFFFSPQGLNLKPKMVTPKTGEPSMTQAHLKQFKTESPEAAAMVEGLGDMGKANKLRSTYVIGFLKHLTPDGKFHPTYMLYKGGYQDDDSDESGTVTGRLSAKDPAFQTIPKKAEKGKINWAKKLRQCFIAPPGYVMFNIDFSQGELRIVACVANEKTMLNAYEQNLDLHAVTGAKLAGVEFEEFLAWKDHHEKAKAAMFDDLRGKAKPANFGLLYGMGWQGFQAYAWASYGLVLSDQEAQNMRNAFFELYPGLLHYHQEYKEYAKINQYVESPLGRIRHLPMIKSWDKEVKARAERQAINSPIQSTLSDMMLWSIALIDANFHPDDVRSIGMVHDALVGYMKEDKVQELMPQVMEIMGNLPFHELGWTPQLKFPVDAEFGPNMADMTKFKLAA
ncbi:DNA polymerase I protein [Rhizobium phage RHph_Y1_11]|nr:DNA polymerase I protein [Rhizobium phage RHph_Y1_11]